MSTESKRDPMEVPVAWEALEDAFENNAPEVHSYLHLDNGEVIRIVDGIADPAMHQRIMGDPSYLRIDPVSSREQYRWMERFIATVEEDDLRHRLTSAIDGKGAFRRFKDVLMSYPVDRERWFRFRSERLRACMEAWLDAHSVQVVERPEWTVPTVEEVKPKVEEQRPKPRPRVAAVDATRRRCHELVELIPARDLDLAASFLEFVRERRHVRRPYGRNEDDAASAPDGDGPDDDFGSDPDDGEGDYEAEQESEQ